MCGLSKIMAGGKKTKRILSKGECSRASNPSALPLPSGKGKGEVVSPSLDPDNLKRWALFGNRKVWLERGINLRVFGSTFIPHAVEAMGWGGCEDP